MNNALPIISIIAWGIGYLTGCFVMRREYKSDLKYLKEHLVKTQAQIEKQVSKRITEDFYAKLSKLGVTLERTALLVEKECKHCANRGKCSIYDNHNIDFCSDWEEKKDGIEEGKSGTEQV